MSDLKIFSENKTVSNKRVIVRLDLNVPIKGSKIEDYTRIKAIEPFINKVYFLQHAKFILNGINQDDFEYIISDTKNRKFVRGFSKVFS